MDNENTDAATLIAESVDDYLRRAYDGDRRRSLVEEGGWNAEFAAELADLGWYGLAVPDSHDGLGAPLSALGPVFMLIGRYLVVGPQTENALLPALLHLSGGWEAFPDIGDAVQTGAPLALVDPGITYDWTDDVGSVILTADGLRGTVNAVRFAGQARLLVVVAEGATGSEICLVDAAGPGVLIEEVASADPTAKFARIVFDNATPVSGADRAGQDELVNRIRSWSRILIACELSGIAQRCVDRTVDYIKQREQFGAMIGSFQAVKHIAADMYAHSTALHNLCIATLSDADHADDQQLYLLAATAKAYASTTALRVCEGAIQLHGGIGFTTENELNLYYKRALALRAWYGDETELEPRIGAAVFQQPPNLGPVS